VTLLHVTQGAAPALLSMTFAQDPGGKVGQERRGEVKCPMIKWKIPGGGSVSTGGQEHHNSNQIICVL
jgi:hypothetical protein